MSDTATLSPPRATLADLLGVEGKAELIRGEVVKQMPTGRWPGTVALRIARSLDDYAKVHGGEAQGDGVGYAVPELSTGRESFAPDASYHRGPPSDGDMDFIEGPPLFAAEVRSKGDYGPAAEEELLFKREEYFEAGTLAVWDVDPVAGTVRLNMPGERSVSFGTGDTAHAEPAMPGWRILVDELFAK